MDTLSSAQAVIRLYQPLRRRIESFFEIRKVRGNNHECDFLVVGLRGRVSLIAFGIGVLKPDRMS